MSNKIAQTEFVFETTEFVFETTQHCFSRVSSVKIWFSPNHVLKRSGSPALLTEPLDLNWPSNLNQMLMLDLTFLMKMEAVQSLLMS